MILRIFLRNLINRKDRKDWNLVKMTTEEDGGHGVESENGLLCSMILI